MLIQKTVAHFSGHFYTRPDFVYKEYLTSGTFQYFTLFPNFYQRVSLSTLSYVFLNITEYKVQQTFFLLQFLINLSKYVILICTAFILPELTLFFSCFHIVSFHNTARKDSIHLPPRPQQSSTSIPTNFANFTYLCTKTLSMTLLDILELFLCSSE